MTKKPLPLTYTFKDPSLLNKALTHPSTTRGQKVSEFERLEFLGDRVLGVVIAQMVYERYPQENEGDLAKRFAALVCREACLEVANQIDLANRLTAAPSAFTTSSVILADAMEALIGAIYLDGGLGATRTFIHAHWLALLEKDVHPPKDAKTALQEWAQAQTKVPVYEVLDHSGPAHTPLFTVRVRIEGSGEAIGTGTSKRQAEQMAAKNLLEGMQI